MSGAMRNTPPPTPCRHVASSSDCPKSQIFPGVHERRDAQLGAARTDVIGVRNSSDVTKDRSPSKVPVRKPRTC